MDKPKNDDKSQAVTLFGFINSVRKRYISFITITILCTLFAIFLSVALPVEYRAKATFALVPPPFSQQLSTSPQILGTLGRLAGLSGSDQSNFDLNFQRLKSRTMIRGFLIKNRLVDYINMTDENGGKENKTLSTTGKNLDTSKSIEKAVDKFKRENLLFSPSVDGGVYTIEIVLNRPELATQICNQYIHYADEIIRTDAVLESRRRLDLLTQRIGAQQLPEVRGALATLLAQEARTLALTSGTTSYAFKIIDVATIPYNKASPQRALICLLGFISGIILASIFIVVRDNVK